MGGDPDIRVTDNPDAQRYEIEADGHLAGFLDYRSRASRIALVHTGIEPAFEGQGLASRLIAHVLDQARARSLEVLPHCPYVRAYIQRHPEYLELVPEGARTRFGL